MIVVANTGLIGQRSQQYSWVYVKYPGEWMYEEDVQSQHGIRNGE